MLALPVVAAEVDSTDRAGSADTADNNDYTEAAVEARQEANMKLAADPHEARRRHPARRRTVPPMGPSSPLGAPERYGRPGGTARPGDFPP